MSNPAQAYESYIVPALFSPWADVMTAHVAPTAGEQLLDVACGTGIVARRAYPALVPDGEAHGVDPNPNMLAVAREVAEREGHPVQFAEGKAEELPYPDDSFDVVTCQQGAQFFADRQQGFTEMKRVLKDGGRAVVSTWHPLPRHDFFSALHSSMEERLGTPAAAAPFSLGNENQLAGLMREAGFQNVAVEQISLVANYPDPERFLDETIDALMAVVVSMLDIPTDELQAGVPAIKRDLRGPLDAHSQGDRVLLPWHANIAKAVA